MRGAFTGAVAMKKAGLSLQTGAHSFLDEISETLLPSGEYCLRVAGDGV
jgi:DNA-binding NtrC family response regulator